MNDLIIAAGTVYTDGTLQAAGVFDAINGLGADAKSATLSFISGIIFVGALINYIRSKFSTASLIVSLLMVAVALGFLGQVDSVKELFGEEVGNLGAASVSQEIETPADTLVL
ncbi:MAG: hypothetical protein ACTIMA_12730 [Brachybacterium tyrofermentans]|uniref:hypothetical protein n=1 Tax=Brachybacterium tyrofermentans TaxID=47848 RepID=UPI003FD50CB9